MYTDLKITLILTQSPDYNIWFIIKFEISQIYKWYNILAFCMLYWVVYIDCKQDMYHGLVHWYANISSTTISHHIFVSTHFTYFSYICEALIHLGLH